MIDRVGNFLIGICLGLVLAAPFAVAATDEVNVYSYRKPQLIDPLFEAFSQQTGIMVNSEKQIDILTNVCKMFHKYGIKSVTMDDIARELGISKKTLYTHFKDKNELVKKSVEFIGRNPHHAKLEEEFNKSKNAIEQLIFIYVTGYKLADEYNFSYEYDLKKYYPEIYSQYQKNVEKTYVWEFLITLNKELTKVFLTTILIPRL